MGMMGLAPSFASVAERMRMRGRMRVSIGRSSLGYAARKPWEGAQEPRALVSAADPEDASTKSIGHRNRHVCLYAVPDHLRTRIVLHWLGPVGRMQCTASVSVEWVLGPLRVLVPGQVARSTP